MPGEERFMVEALTLAERGRGSVEPNPLVGAVVVDAQGTVVGRGWHERFGAAHAEENALREAGGRGQTLYVTLEPCCHHGKTPPCTDAILAAGIGRVVAAMSDPFPRVNGGGFAILKNARITVEIGLEHAAATKLNAPYLKLQTTGMPWVHAKWAMTLDGRIATRTGSSQWISGPDSAVVTHALRGKMDAILVGRGTVIADDPMLTARPPGPRVATRVIVTASGDLPHDCQVLRSANEVPVIVYTQHPERLKSRTAAEIVEATEPQAILRDLGRRQFTNVLIEGGPGVLGSFFAANAIDEVHAFIAPKLTGGAEAPGPIGGLGFEHINDALALNDVTCEALGRDVYIHGRIS